MSAIPGLGLLLLHSLEPTVASDPLGLACGRERGELGA